MNKWMCLLACLLVPAIDAQTAPKVVFTGDDFTLAWQQTSQFTTNHNWIGAGVSVPCCLSLGSGLVEEDLPGQRHQRTSQLRSHPDGRVRHWKCS